MNHQALDLEVLRKLNGSNKNWVNKDLYRLLYKEELYIVTYEKIKSKPGNMTPGTDHTTIDGFSTNQIDELIEEMRTETFQFSLPKRSKFPNPAEGNENLEFLAFETRSYRKPCG